MNYFVYTYQPIKNCDSMCMLSFKPVLFKSKEEAEQYASIFEILEYTQYCVMDEETFFESFGNLTLNEVSVCDS